MAYQLSILPCCLDTPHPTHPPAVSRPLRIQIEGPKVSIDKLFPGISWQTSAAIPTSPQPAGPKLAALAYQAVYGVAPRPGTNNLAVRDEYLGWIMPMPTREIDYYGVTFDHGVPADDMNPEVLQINILEMEEDNGAYANKGILFQVDPAKYASVSILAVPRCCQRRKGTTDRLRINSAVETRVAIQAGMSWLDRVQQLENRGELRPAKPVV